MIARRKETPLDRAWSALGLLNGSIQWDERRGETTGTEYVEAGLDAMASALNKLKHLDLEAAPLDEVLAEIGAEDDLVETAADLIELVGRAAYSAGLSEDEATTADGLREKLLYALDELLNEIKTQPRGGEEPEDE